MEERDPDLVSLIDERKGWERLIATPEWGKLVTMLQGQADELQRTIVFTPLMTGDGAYLQEFRKGQLEGRLSITNTIETIISELEAEIERKRVND